MSIMEEVNRQFAAATRGAIALDQRQASSRRNDPWLDPEPLPEQLPPVPALDEALLPDALHPWLTDIAERLQCPLEYPAVGALVALASVVGRQVGIRPKRRDDWLVVPNLWGAIVGRPGVLKTPALAEALKPLTRLEIGAREEFDAASRDYEAHSVVTRIDSKRIERTIAAKMKEGDKEGARDLAYGLTAQDEAPTRRRYRSNDATVEKLGELLGTNPNGILMFRDELTGLLRSLDREGQEGARAFYLEAWNGAGRYTYDRIGRGTVEIEAACVSILGGIQPGPLTEYLTGALRRTGQDDGLLQRFQLVVWPDPTGQWRNVDRWPDSEAKQRAWNVFQRLDALDVAGAEGDDDIPSLRFNDGAQAIFDDWRGALEHRLRSDSESPAFEAHLAKYRSLVPSLALLIHLIDDPATGAVSEAALVAAIAWGEFLEAHARRLYAPALDPALAAARELDRHIRNGDLGTVFTTREVYRPCWRLLDKRGAQEALEYLADLGRVRSEEQDTGGRPSVQWRVNPALTEGRA